MTRVIITGGTGLIGRRLVPALNAAGHESIVLSRNIQNREGASRAGAKLVQWDALTGEGWSQLIDADTVIINLAGENLANWRWTLTHKRIVLRSRLDAVRAVVDGIRRAGHKPNAVLQASAVGYYGARGELSMGEITSPGDGWRAEVAKLWEAESDAIEAEGVRRVLLRVGVVLDPHGGALPVYSRGGWLMAGRLGDGQQWMPWVHHADVVGAMRFLLDHDDIHGAVNIVAPYPVTNAEFLRALGKARRWPAWIPVPAGMLRATLGEMATMALDSQRVYPPLLLNAGYTFQFPQIDGALRDLLQRGAKKTTI